ncbi:WPP domain-associated protein isoform X2 [Andrographis paniculata]|nr:WPP domain-associated protein isoform X2 [Andrographis paniculata]
MESQEVMANGWRGDSALHGDALEFVNSENGFSHVAGDDEEKGNLAEEVLGDLEEYWEDINDRLMISRMVSDSVIKGMVTAVEQEAAEKELEVASLKELLYSDRVGSGRFEQELKSRGFGRFSNLPTLCVKIENSREELNAVRNLTIEQLVSVKKDIGSVSASNSLWKIGSGLEWLGLGGGSLPEKQCARLVHIDEILQNLEKTVDIVCTKADDVLHSSKVSLCELQQEQDILASLEGIVIESVFKRLKDEFEEKLLEQLQNTQFGRIQSMNWLGKFHELSNLGGQLDAILKSLSIHDSGLVSHGSHDLDQLHQKIFTNHVTPSCGENGTLDASSIHVAEIYDIQQLQHLSKEGMVDYFNDIIIKMKREHESALHQKTEQYFRLKREYLKERSSFVTHRDEEFDVLRKKIPEVISKLENFLLENERFPALIHTSESIGNMKQRLEILHSENQELRDCLAEKQKEVKHLEMQVADSAAQQLQHSLSKEMMPKLTENRSSAVEESHMEALLNELVFNCAIRNQIAQTRSDSNDKHLEVPTEQPEAVVSAEAEDKYENEDSEVESLIAEGFCGLVYAEAVKDAEHKFSDLNRELLVNKNIINCLEVKAGEKENELSQVVEETNKLKREILDMGTAMEQKEKLAADLSVSLSKQREQFEQASQELENIRQHAAQQQTLVIESNQELQLLKSEHLKALKQIQIDKIEMHKLNQTTEMLMVANKRELEMAVSGISKMFDDFECRASGVIKKNNLRLENTKTHLKDLNEMAYALKRKELTYKQRLERKFADLQMAESEVDLLGDEVDALLRLLEKIYIALDHYSPILKHYPGIIEILKLVRRELSGEATRIHD